MTDSDNLGSLLRWIELHPNLTIAEIKRSVRVIPWPIGDPNNWKPPYEGTRMDRNIPSITCLDWRLRFLELRGDIYKSGYKKGCPQWSITIDK